MRDVLWGLFIAAMVFSETAVARMYQWVSPATGTPQLSGEPPAWYRAGIEGPRILVFENGFLVDDTDIEVSELKRTALRDEAFEELERRQTIEALRRLGASVEEARERAEQEPADDEAVAAVADDNSTETPAEPSISDLPDVLDKASIERLKSIIARYDKAGAR